MIRTGTRDVGMEYQYKVLTYLAASLSQNPKVRDFLIHTNFEDIPGFDDLIAKVWYEDKSEPFVYLGQVKHRVNKINFDNVKHTLTDYDKNMKTIIDNKTKIAILNDVPIENIHFWFYTNNYINKDIKVSRKIPCDLQPDQSYEIPFLHQQGLNCYKLIPLNASEDELSLEKLYLLLNQPKNSKIEEKIQNILGVSKTSTEDITKYVDQYLNIPKIGGLTKYIFEVEILRIHLSKFVVKPTLAIDMNEKQSCVWNKIIINHELTIIKKEKDIEKNLFGCFLQQINDIYDIKFDWNGCIIQDRKLEDYFSFKKFVDYFKDKDIQLWVSAPDNVDSLIQMMWKYDALPLVLKTDAQLTILKKYKHLKKKFVIIDDNKQRHEELCHTYDNVFMNVSDIISISLRNELLQEILVSFQGRKPVSLLNIIATDENSRSQITKALTSTDILNLMKKREVYLRKSVLEETERMIFIIYDKNANDIPDNLDNILNNFSSQTIKIKCKTRAEGDEYKKCIKEYPKRNKRDIFEIVLIENNRLKFLAGDVEKLKHFIVDEDDCDAYRSKNGKVVPIIGRKLGEYLHSYIPRTLIKNGREFNQNEFSYETEDGVVVIKAEPGMGKTSLLQSLSENEYYNPQNYRLYCNLRDLLEDFQKHSQKILNAPLDFIFERFECSRNKNLLRHIYKDHRDNGKLTLFLDAFDEVLPVCKEQTLNFIKEISKMNVKVILTSRLSADKLLEDNFHIQSIKIGQFNTEDIKKYLENSNLNSTIIHKIGDLTKETPLYLKFIINLHQENVDFDKMDKYELYKKLLEKNIGRYYDKKKDVYDPSIQVLNDDILQIHRLMALIVVYGKDRIIENKIINNYESLKAKFIDLKLKVGFVKYFNDSAPVFMHRTIAEFLAMEWLNEELRSPTVSEFAITVYKELVPPNGLVYEMKYFLDRMICIDLPLHTSIISADLETSKYLCNKDDFDITQCDICGRSVLHLISGYLYRSRLCAKVLDIIIQRLTKEKYDFNTSDLYLKWNWWQWIDRNKNFFPSVAARHSVATVNLYLENSEGIKYRKYGLDALPEISITLAIIFNNPAVALILLKRNKSLIHEYFFKIANQALISNRLDIFYELIILYNTEKSELMRFHVACSDSDTSIVILKKEPTRFNKLLDFNEHVEMEISHDLSALHLACIYGNAVLAEELINAGSNLYSVDVFSNIPLHYAIRKNSYVVVEMLLKKMRRKMNKTRLLQKCIYLACKYSDPDIINLLLKGTVIENLYYMNPNSSDILKILLYFRCDIFKRNQSGMTALEIACQKGNLYIVKKLMETHAFYKNVDVISNVVRAINERYYLLADHVTEYLLSNFKHQTLACTLRHLFLHDQTTLIDHLLQADIINKNDLQCVIRNDVAIYHEVTKRKQSSSIKFLLSEDISVTLRDKYGYTPLHYVQNEDDALLFLNKYYSNALPGGRKISSKTQSNQTAELAIDCNQTNYNNVPLNKIDHSTSGVIRITITSSRHLHNTKIKNSDTLPKLIKYFSNINGVDVTPKCCLHLETRSDTLEVFHILKELLSENLKIRLKVNSHLMNGVTKTSIESEEIKIISIKEEYGRFSLTCLEGRCDVIQYLIKRYSISYTIGFANEHGITNLIRHNFLAPLETLFDENFINILDLEYQSAENQTALTEAISKDHYDIVEFLINKGIDLRYEHIWHAIEHCENPSQLIIKLMLRKFPSHLFDANKKCENGSTSLHSACKKGDLNVVRELLLAGYNTAIKDIFNRTPIHVTIINNRNDSTQIVEELIKNGASVNEVDDNDKTALDYAIVSEEHHEELIKILKKHGGLRSNELPDGHIQFGVGNYVKNENDELDISDIHQLSDVYSLDDDDRCRADDNYADLYLEDDSIYPVLMRFKRQEEISRRNNSIRRKIKKRLEGKTSKT